MKILYISRDLGLTQNGASHVMNRNLRILKQIVGENNVIEYALPRSTINNVINSIIHISSYGVPYKIERDILNITKERAPDYVFIESSSMGSIFRKLKKIGAKTICFAHNVDTSLCKHELISRNPIISVPKFLLTIINEKKTAKYCNILICLTKRDSNGFKKLFDRKADLILPITFPDPKIDYNPVLSNEPSYFLFVGSDFFPNTEGILWFIKNVAPFVKNNFRIVGSCCENPSLKNLTLPENVKLVGYTADLDNEYINAQGVIAPIFKGSGMKTKTIEALRFGKYIYGTQEAFAGIECDFSQIGALCNNANDFINSLNMASKSKSNPYSMCLFKTKFSDSSFFKQLKCVLNE